MSPEGAEIDAALAAIGIDPTAVPPLEKLDALTDDELYLACRWWSERNHAIVALDFWLDELSRRRTAHVLEAIAAATADNAAQVATMADLTKQGADQNAEMVDLNRSMRRLTFANAFLALGALIVAVIALVAA